jgi:hypothetical protein
VLAWHNVLKAFTSVHNHLVVDFAAREPYGNAVYKNSQIAPQ